MIFGASGLSSGGSQGEDAWREQRTVEDEIGLGRSGGRGQNGDGYGEREEKRS